MYNFTRARRNPSQMNPCAPKQSRRTLPPHVMSRGPQTDPYRALEDELVDHVNN